MKRKLLLTIGLWTLLISGMMGWLNYYETQNQLQSLMDSQLSDAAHIILKQSIHEMREHIYVESEDVLKEELLEDRNLPSVEFQILGENKQILFRSSKLMPIHSLSKIQGGYDNQELSGEPWRVYVLSSKDRRFQVQVAQKISFRKELAQRFLITVLMPLFLLIPILLFFISISISRRFKPLEKLTSEVKNRGPHSLGKIDSEEIYFEPELNPIVVEMNALLDRLQKALDAEKRMTASAAHELRTPLAQLKIQSQIAILTEDPKVKQSALQTINDVIDKLTRRVSQLLSLARLDHEVVELEQRPFDLKRVLNEELTEIAPFCLEKQIELSAHTEDFYMDGYEDLFAILIRNLLENATKYTPNGGNIEVNLCRNLKGGADLSIVDSGPGIKEEELKSLFESETSTHLISKDSTGIGLTLVKKIAQCNGVNLKIINGKTTPGLTVTLHINEAKI